MKQINIEGFEGYFVTEDGKVFSSKRGYWKEIAQSVQRKYWAVKLWVSGKCKHIHVHRLLAITFIDNPENKPFVNHKDGDKLNCCVSNLEWVTRQENVDHAMENDLVPAMIGVNNGRALLTDNQVKEIYFSLLDGESSVVLAKLYGVEQTTIGNIKRRRLWKHITKDFPVINIKPKTEKQSEDKVHEVCKMLELGVKPTPIAEQLKVPIDLVYDLKRRKGFTHITSLYNW
jgi:hypothetical protein